LLLYFFSEGIDLSAAQGFLITGIIILLLVLAIASQVSGYFFNILARFFVKPFYKVTIKNFPKEKTAPTILVSERLKGVYIALLSAFNPELHFYLPRSKKRYVDSFFRLFSSVDFIYVKDPKEEGLKAFLKKVHQKKSLTPCLLFPYPKFLESKSSTKLIKDLKKVGKFTVTHVEIKRVSRKEQIDRKHFKRPQVTFSFKSST
ncbi:MAG: hypothetical protein KDK60_03600, partial [Chlamydiia bacterium]|nr:hypothetical protein [Chlamydiia bacterium]